MAGGSLVGYTKQEPVLGCRLKDFVGSFVPKF